MITQQMPFPDDDITRIKQVIYPSGSGSSSIGYQRRIWFDFRYYRLDKSIPLYETRQRHVDTLEHSTANTTSQEVMQMDALIAEMRANCLPDHFVLFDVKDDSFVQHIYDECYRVCEEFEILSASARELSPHLEIPIRGDWHYFGVIGFQSATNAMMFKMGADISQWCHLD